MKKNNKIIGGILALVLISILMWIFLTSSNENNTVETSHVLPSSIFEKYNKSKSYKFNNSDIRFSGDYYSKNRISSGNGMYFVSLKESDVILIDGKETVYEYKTIVFNEKGQTIYISKDDNCGSILQTIGSKLFIGCKKSETTAELLLISLETGEINEIWDLDFIPTSIVSIDSTIFLGGSGSLKTINRADGAISNELPKFSNLDVTTQSEFELFKTSDKVVVVYYEKFCSPTENAILVYDLSGNLNLQTSITDLLGVEPSSCWLAFDAENEDLGFIMDANHFTYYSNIFSSNFDHKATVLDEDQFNIKFSRFPQLSRDTDEWVEIKGAGLEYNKTYERIRIKESSKLLAFPDDSKDLCDYDCRIRKNQKEMEDDITNTDGYGDSEV